MPMYLHKGVSRDEAEALLHDAGVRGAYLVRDSGTLAGAYVLCVWSGERMNQYRIVLNDDGLLALSVREGLRERYFATLDTMMQHYINLGEKNGLACQLKLPIDSGAQKPTASLGTRPLPGRSDPSPIPDVDEVVVEEVVDNITPFFQHRQSVLDLSVIDGEFIEELRSYIDDHVRHDASTVSQPQYSRPYHPAPSIHDNVPRLHKLLEKSSLSLQRELHLYLLKLDVIGQLFAPRDQSPDQSGSDQLRLRATGSLLCLLSEMESCRTQVEQVMESASSTLTDLTLHQKELASAVARIEDDKKESLSNIQQCLPKYVPPTMFEVKTYRKNFSQLKSVQLSVDLHSGSLSEVVPGRDDTLLTIQHHKIDQVIKSQVNSSMVEMKVDGIKKKKVLVFNDVRSREKFCQLVQTMKNLHMDDDNMDSVSVFVGTWNMGDEVPRDGLASWLQCRGDGKQLDDGLQLIPHDFYVIGTQESASSEKDWSKRLKATLFNIFHIQFQTVTMETLWGIRLVVLCKPCHVNNISHVETSTVKTGIANALGNKGGVAVSFDFNSTSVCFVCCHLAARAENVSKRNQNYRDISRGLCLGDRRYSHFDLTSRFHHVMWLGDLNYRVDEEIGVCLGEIRDNNCTSLLASDQLIHVQKQKDAFIDFSEGEITFRPTYRYEKGRSDVYAWRKVKKTVVRINVPSWCDRVLWKSFPDVYVENLAYGCQDKVLTSDHRPVFASFRLGIIQQFAAKMTSPGTKQDDVIISFQSCEAEINSQGRQNYFLEFHSACLDGPISSTVTASSQNMGTMATGGTANRKSATEISRVKWVKINLPRLQPIVADRDFLEDQYLLIVVKSEHNNEIYGECVVGLKNHISVVPQYFEARLTHSAEETGILRGEMHVTSLSTAFNLSNRRRTAKTYECIKFATENLIVLDEAEDADTECRSRSAFDLQVSSSDTGYHGNGTATVDDMLFSTDTVEQRNEVYGDLSACSSGVADDTSTDDLDDLYPPPPLPPRTDSLETPCPVIVPTTGLPALIAQWLQSIGLGQHQCTFLQHECTSLQSLDKLTDESLEMMGVSNHDDRSVILDSLHKVNVVNSKINQAVDGAAGGDNKNIVTTSKTTTTTTTTTGRPKKKQSFHTAPTRYRKPRNKAEDLFN